MKLVDTDETIVLVTGSDIRAEERDRPTAYWLKNEIDRRGEGVAFRRAVVVGDIWYLANRIFHLNPTVAIGGPGVNALSRQWVEGMPAVWSREDRAFVHTEFGEDHRRAVVWGMDAATTAEAVRAFASLGPLDDLLARSWRFRAQLTD